MKDHVYIAEVIRISIASCCVTVLCMLLSLGISYAGGTGAFIEVYTGSPTPVNPVTNPGFGLTIPNYRPGVNEQLHLKKEFPYADIAYKRFLWSELEPFEGGYNFHIIEKWIEYWRGKGYRVGFGVMSTTDGRQGTPRWLFETGVPGVVHMHGRQIDPVMWNEKYLDKLGKFVRALGKKLNGGKGIEFVDMRGIGMWGEMHFGLNIKGMWTAEEMYSKGFSEDNLTNAYFRQMEFYKKYFPFTNLFLNIAPDQANAVKDAPYLRNHTLPKTGAEYKKLSGSDRAKRFVLPISERIINRAAALNIGLRYDGLSHETNTSSRMISGYFRKHCAPGGTSKCLYEFARQEREQKWIRQMMDRALKDHASYINLNFQEIQHVNQEIKEDIKSIAARIGYHLFLTKVTVSALPVQQNNGGAKLVVNHSWVNRGNVTPACKHIIKIEIVDETGKSYSSIANADKTSAWMWIPGSVKNLTTSVSLPRDIREGKYSLFVNIRDLSGRPINLYLAPVPGKEGMYAVASFMIRRDAKDNTLIIRGVK